MAQTPDLSRYLDAGAQFVALTRAQARARAKELVGTGQLAQEQVQGFVDDLVDESRRRTDEMLELVRREIQRQVKALGFATKDDLARLEARVGSGGAGRKGAPKRTSTKASPRKASARKVTANKATANKTTKKTTTAKKTRKSPKRPAAG